MRTKQASVFLCLLAASWIIDYRDHSFSNLPATPGGLFVLGSVLFFGCMLFGPSSTSALLASSAVALVALVLDPHLSNHETIYVAVFLAIPCAWIVAAVRERTLRVDRRHQGESLAGVLRLVFLVSYSWSAVQKWNDDFLSPPVSCAAHQVERLMTFFPALSVPESFLALAGPLTIAIELLLPSLLIVPATRRLGVLLGLGFHTILGAGFPGFQLLVFGFLSLFVPEGVWQAVFARVAVAVRRTRRVAEAARFLERPVARALSGLALAIASSEFFEVVRRPGAQHLMGQQIYPMFSVVMLGGLALAAAALVLRSPAWRTSPPVAVISRIPVVLWLLPLGVFLQGLQPHLGIKNVQSFAMFSNLDTDNGQSNHWLIPAAWQISSNLSDPVIVHDSSHPRLRRLSARTSTERSVLRAPVPPRLLPAYVELRREVSRLAREGAEAVMLDYTRAGVRRHVEHAEHDPELANASFLERFYLKTRPIAVNRHGACRW